MKKNVASQIIGAQLCSATDGSDFTSTVTCYVTGNGGTQALGSVGSGVCTHEGNGFHTYTPAQAETNYDHAAFTFKGTGAVTATVQVYPTFPQTGDNFALIGTTGSGLTSLATAANLATANTKLAFLPAATAGAAGGLFIAGSNAATTVNITGTISTVTTLTNLPAITAGWLTASGIAASALNGKGDWNVGKTGYSLTQGFPSNFSSLSITAGGLVDITQTAADKAWGTTSRVLTAGTNIALAKGTGVTGFNDLDAAGVATAVWNAATASYGSAGSYGLLIETNLDAQVSTVGGGSLTAAGIADAVWDEAISGHLTGGTTGASLSGAGSAGDPWGTPVPGSYVAGTAGKILGDYLNATVSSRATQTSVDTVDDFIDTEVAAIKAKTDFLPSATAGAAGGLFIAGSNAATTVNFTGTITTVSNLTNLPSITAGWITAAGIAASALNGKGDWNIGKTGYSLTQGFPTNFSSLSITAGGLVDITQTAADKAWGTAARVLTAGTNIALAKGTGVTGFNDLDAGAVAAATWNAATASYGSAGSYGELIETNLDAAVSSVSGGGTADWTANEKTTIKAILGIPASGTTPDDPTTGILDTIRDAVLLGNTYVDTEVGALTTAVAAVKADTAATLTDAIDIQARLPAALVSGRMDSNLSAIGNSTATMAAFNRAVKGNVIGTVGVGSTTTSIVTSSVTPVGSVADKFKGRLLTFSDDTTTVNLRGQSTDITANTSAAAPTLTVTALTTAAASGDTFSIT